MNTRSFLRDWQPGDVLTADGLQEIVDAVAMLEHCHPAGGGATGVAGARRVVDDGAEEWPWQIYAMRGENGIRLRYVPGKVLIGARIRTDAQTAEEQLVYEYAEPDPGLALYEVDGFNAGSSEPVTVWLEMTGTVGAEDIVEGAGDEKTVSQCVTLENPVLRVTCEPAEDALRVWPLAVYTPGHGQPVTQLLWGDLSALEVRAVLDVNGAPLWPVERSGACWGDAGHGSDMSELCGADFSTECEQITGSLRGCIDDSGALELYLGPWPDEDDDYEESLPEDPWAEDADDPDDDTPPPGPFTPVRPDDAVEEPGEPVRVRYGYVAGAGFSSCRLVLTAEGMLYWELTLDSDYLVRACADLKVRASVTFEAGGSAPGALADVEMGLGECSAEGAGMSLDGSAELLFHATNDVDVSKKTDRGSASFVGSPNWSQEQKWYLSPSVMHRAGTYVRLAAAGDQSDAWVEAVSWYKFEVNAAAFRKAALNYFKARLEAVSLGDSDSSTSGDAEVTATLSGTALQPKITMTLQ